MPILDEATTASRASILNEHHRWVAVSAPTLLTVNERESEQALVFLDATCVARQLKQGSEERVTGAR